MLTVDAVVGIVASALVAGALVGLWGYETSQMPEYPPVERLPPTGMLTGWWSFVAGGPGGLPGGIAGTTPDTYRVHLEAKGLPPLGPGLEYVAFLSPLPLPTNRLGELVLRGDAHVLDWSADEDGRRADDLWVAVASDERRGMGDEATTVFRMRDFTRDASATGEDLVPVGQDAVGDDRVQREQLQVWRTEHEVRVGGGVSLLTTQGYDTGLWLVDKDGKLAPRLILRHPWADTYPQFDGRLRADVPAHARILFTIEPATGTLDVPGFPYLFADLAT